MDVPVLLATAIGGLVAAIAAFGGSLWLERTRAAKLHEQAAKHVLQELSDLRIPVASLAFEGVWFGSVGFSRSAWIEARTVLADALTLGEMESISNGYLYAKEAFDHFEPKAEASYGKADPARRLAAGALAAIDESAEILVRHLPTRDRDWPPDPPRPLGSP